MEIRVKETGQLMQLHELRALHPNTTGPLDDLYDVVLYGPYPAPTRYQTVYRDGVEEIGGQWFTKYSLADMGDEARAAADEQQKAAMRTERNRRLAETDWRAVKANEEGTPLANEWVVYRKALRDITHEPGFPWDTPWPTPPQD